VIGTNDSIFEDQNFALSTNEISFTIEPIAENVNMSVATNVNTIDALFSDEKLRNVDNFLYLPPIKKSNVSNKKDIESLKSAGLLLGDYPAWGPTNRLTYSDIKNELKNYESSVRTVLFDPTSRDNQLIAQFFEITYDSVSKLDVIDYGRVNDNTENPYAASHHVFFVGKVVVDDYGSDNFVHLFTLVFGADEQL
jgi:hypothetical protein